MPTRDLKIFLALLVMLMLLATRVHAEQVGQITAGGVTYVIVPQGEATKPVWMEVVGDFNIRGGIKSVITASIGARTKA